MAAKGSKDPYLRARACWQVFAHGWDEGYVAAKVRSLSAATELCESLLRDPDPRFRGLALRFLKDAGLLQKQWYWIDKLKPLSLQEEPALVRREALLAIR